MRCIVISIVISALLTPNLFARDGEPSPLAKKEAAKGNWSTWRGLNHDGLSAETGLLSSWQEHEPKLTWKIKGLGNGFFSVAVSERRIYTMGQRDGVTKMIALSTKAGTKIWEVDVDSEANDGPNSTPSVDEERVYGLTHAGQLVCINTTNDSILWKKHFLTDFKGKMESRWGYSESPIIDGGNLICTPGGNSAVMVALNKKTGEHI